VRFVNTPVARAPVRISNCWFTFYNSNSRREVGCHVTIARSRCASMYCAFCGGLHWIMYSLVFVTDSPVGYLMSLLGTARKPRRQKALKTKSSTVLPAVGTPKYQQARAQVFNALGLSGDGFCPR
jgi:hypothetical protein